MFVSTALDYASSCKGMRYTVDKAEVISENCEAFEQIWDFGFKAKLDRKSQEDYFRIFSCSSS
jgi:hypothetical protein